ncbi:hypothetical protein HK097_002850 [Rhizophlyctis rosea]|uniref:Uncharacterized protein n=1 Tax=Rhizophlyctis rosea TaxID=64517 RepID=A0AAD5SG77_9FUNG|nr:hypothetical protein HK097_002850 [Rhizophlyctis rosea]
MSPSGIGELLLTLIALEEGHNDEAINHVRAIPAGDHKIDLLLNAADRAFKKGNKVVLKGILKELVTADIDWSDGEKKHSALVLLRCLIRMTNATSNDSSDRFNENALYIEKAHKILSLCNAQESLYEAELDWLFRTSWNLAIQAATTAGTEEACILYNLTAKLLLLFPVKSVHCLQSLKICAFAILVGKVNLSRQDETEGSPHLDDALAALELLRGTLEELRKIDPEGVKEDPVVGQSVYLEFEVRVKRKEWEGLKGIVEYAECVDASVQIFERMAVTRHNCPSGVVFVTVQATLDAILKRDPEFDLTKFSQWFRVLVRTALVSNRDAAFGLFEQVKAIVKSSASQGNAYPEEEINWLMITAW